MLLHGALVERREHAKVRLFAVRDVFVVVIGADMGGGDARVLVDQLAIVAFDERERARLAREVILRCREQMIFRCASIVAGHRFHPVWVRGLVIHIRHDFAPLAVVSRCMNSE